MSIIVTDSGFRSPYIEASPTIHNPGATIDLPSDFDPVQITPEVLQARGIRIELPSFADGRGFTLASLLRRRGYVGHLQAFGHVLADQYAMAQRSELTMCRSAMSWPRASPKRNGSTARIGARMITKHGCASLPHNC